MSEYEVGVQSVVFQHRSLSELLDDLGETGIDSLELWGHHLSPGDDEATIEAGERAIVDAGVDVCGYGVADLDEPGQAREHVAFADRLGAGYVTVNYPPDADEITEELVALADEFEIDVAIHNYSSVHHDDLSTVFSSIEDVRSVLDRHDHPRLGACVDTGHFLVEEVDPEAAIESLGERIHAVHLKDTTDSELEDVPGSGLLELPSLLELLDEHADLDAPLVIEYELPEDRALEALKEAEANVRAAIPK